MPKKVKKTKKQYEKKSRSKKSRSKNKHYKKRFTKKRKTKTKTKQRGKGIFDSLKKAAKEELKNQTDSMFWNKGKMTSEWEQESKRDKKCKDKYGEWINPAPDGCPPIPCSRQPRKSKYCNGNTPSSTGREKCKEPKNKGFGIPEHTWFGSEFCDDNPYVHGDVIVS